MNGISEPTQEQYIETLEDDLKAYRAAVEQVKQLFILAQLDDSGAAYSVSAGAFNALMDCVELLRE